MKKVIFMILMIFFVYSAYAERVIIPESEVNRVGFDKIKENAEKFIRKSHAGYYIFEISLDKLKEIGVRHYKVEDKKISISAIPDDTHISKQWSIFKTSLDRLWDNNTDCSNIIVAVVDTGTEYTHPDLKDNIYINNNEVCDDGIDNDNNGYIDDCFGWDFAYNDNLLLDGQGHGTHVAGIIGATGNNSTGIAGTCWKAKIMTVKVLDNSGDGNETDVAEGIYYAVDNGADIVNLSIEANFALPLIYNAISYAEEKGVLVVAAAGNFGYDLNTNYIYPASYSIDLDNLINVGNSNQSDHLGDLSDYGSIVVDIFAPGEDIYSTYLQNSYDYLSGTSMAAPFITGLLAHYISISGKKDPLYMKAHIIKSADEVSQLNNKSISGGRINAEKLLNEYNGPAIVKVFPETFSTNRFRPALNEQIELYGYLRDVQNVYVDDIPVSFTQNDNNTIYINVPFVSGNFQVYAKDIYGNTTNKALISPYTYKVKANDAFYTFTTSVKVTGLSNDSINGYNTVGEKINFNITSSYNTITLNVSKSSSIDGQCYIKDENDNVYEMVKIDTNNCQLSNVISNKNYIYFEGASTSTGSGGGGCSFAGNIDKKSLNVSLFMLSMFIVSRIFRKKYVF